MRPKVLVGACTKPSTFMTPNNLGQYTTYQMLISEKKDGPGKCLSIIRGVMHSGTDVSTSIEVRMCAPSTAYERILAPF